jgi:hypothetical protein
MVLLELLGSTLIFEENFLIGFLPLRSYFLTRKHPDITGKKCPSDKEEILRGLIIKEALELLNCVPEQAKPDPSIGVSDSDLELQRSDKVEDFFAQIDSQDITR